MTTAHVGARAGEGVLVALLGVMAGVALLGLMLAGGPGMAMVPLVLVVGWWLLGHPVATLGLLFVTTVWFEESKGVWPIAMDRWYAAFGGVFHAPDLLVLLLLGWVILDRRGRDSYGPGLGNFALPLALLFVATLGGLVTGYVGGGDTAVIYNSARVLSFLVIVPYVAAAVLTRFDLTRRAIVFATVVVTARALVGLLGWFVNGRGGGANDDGLTGVYASLDASAISFYEPTMNFLMVFVILGVTAALVLRHRIPRWLVLAAPAVVLTLGVSYRRSFWIAAILGLVLVLLVSTGRRGRPWLLLGGAAVAIALYAAMFAGGATDTTNPVIYRAQSLTPSKLVASSEDRYRLDEQRNVIAEIRAHPTTGLGLGVPWTARFPTSENPPGGRMYSHVTPLWFWLRLGPFGFLAYVWTMGTVITTGYAVWRRSADTLVRIAGLTMAASFIGLLVAELTGPFSGIDVRVTLVESCLIGWLIAARWSARPAATTADGERQEDPRAVALVG